MHVLVAFGSDGGGTAGIADIIGQRLRAAGHSADVTPASEVHGLDGYGAVIVGGSLRSHRWHHDAARFVARQAPQLRGRPVWFFSSGPLDDSASRTEIPPTKQVAKLYARVHARGHVTFGGALAPDARGFIASKMAKTRAGDWRDPPRIGAWADEIAAELSRAVAPPPLAAPARPRRAVRRSAVALCVLTGVTAAGGGLALALRPDGSLLQAPLAVLRHTPFASFLVPGLLLAAVVGLSNLVGALALALTERKIGEALSFLAGAALTGFVAAEMALLRTVNGLQLFFFAVGLFTMLQSLKMRRQRPA